MAEQGQISEELSNVHQRFNKIIIVTATVILITFTIMSILLVFSYPTYPIISVVLSFMFTITMLMSVMVYLTHMFMVQTAELLDHLAEERKT